MPDSVALAADAPRPNVLLICVDDLKPALGCYGDRLARSPNIDRLAARGLLFERAYCNQAVCAPSRNSLLTGLRPQTLGIYDLGTNFRRAVPDAVTLPQWFKQHGYRAEGLGKIFHVGHGNHEDPASWSVPHWKTEVVAYAKRDGDKREGLTREEALFSGKSPEGLPRGAPYEAADVPDNAYPDGALADEVIRRLDAAAKKPGGPFFLAVGFVKPHLPFCAPKKYWDLHDPAAFALAERKTPPEGAPAYAPQFGGELRQYAGVPANGPVPDEMQRKLIHGYYAAVSYMDAQLGRVLDELDRLKLSERTIVVLWGDHGWHLGDHGIWCKHTNYEQATHIPLIIAAPGVTKAGSRTTSLAETVDLYPTLCELAVIEGQPPQGLGGKSLVPVLRDPRAATKEAILHVYPRSPKEKGPLVGRAVRTDRYRLVEWKKPGAPADAAEIELYDYADDPGETRNVADEKPPVVAQLRAILARQPEAKPQIKPLPQPRPAPAPRAQFRPQPPNVVVILADDLGYGDVGCFGHKFKTPHLDRMAAEGARLTNFYAACPFCAPTRASLLTGRYPFRSGMNGNPSPDGGANDLGIPESELLLGELFHQAGYATAAYGKWHLGHRPQFFPTRHGFDDYFGILYSNDMRPVELRQNEERAEYPVAQQTLTERYTERAIGFIEKNVEKDKDRPFFLYLPYAMPHKPLAASDRFYKQSGAGLYGDVIAELDEGIGRVLAKIKELGLDERTLVIFASDNGPWYGGSSGGLRGMKGQNWEGGIRVPLIARWPGKIPPGRVSHEPAIMMDVFATTLTAAGIPLPSDRPIDGRDILPLLTSDAKSPHEAIFSVQGKNLSTVRVGPWKLHARGTPRKDNRRSGWIDPRGPDGQTILAPAEQYGPEHFPGLTTGDTSSEPALFDLASDPAEQHNVAAQHPEIVRRLQGLFEKMDAQLATAGKGP